MGDGPLQAQDVRSSFSEVKATVTPVDDGFDIRVQTWGCPASTIRFEFGILPNVLIRGEGYRIPANAGGSFAAKGELELFDGKDTVSVGPGFAVNDDQGALWRRAGVGGSVQPLFQRRDKF